MSGGWVSPEVRAEVIEFVRYWHPRGEFKVGQLLGWLGLSSSKYYAWREGQGQVQRPNDQLSKGHGLLAWEKSAIEAYARQHRHAGYRRLSYMMLDEEVVAVSPSSVYRVLQVDYDRQKNRQDCPK